MKKGALVFLSALAFLTACEHATTAMMGADVMNFFMDEKINMTEKNYAVADYLVERGGGFVKKEHIIKARPLLDVEEPRIIPGLAKQIPEQIGQRMIQLGYTVDLSEVSTDVEPELSSRPPPAIGAADYILSGSYTKKSKMFEKTMDVRIRIVDAVTGIERAAFDYTIPRTGELRRDSNTKPVIFKTN
ncbi:MAG: hypothetical protein IT558_03180 [Alphaproteobacteria bacterium]|nr:hypothetical protein [Alphaproteobacteria bacterium]